MLLQCFNQSFQYQSVSRSYETSHPVPTKHYFWPHY